jgi:hypothetical protein
VRPEMAFLLRSCPTTPRHPCATPRLGLHAVVVLGLVLALPGSLTGSSITAVRALAGLSSCFGWLEAAPKRLAFPV